MSLLSQDMTLFPGACLSGCLRLAQDVVFSNVFDPLKLAEALNPPKSLREFNHRFRTEADCEDFPDIPKDLSVQDVVSGRT